MTDHPPELFSKDSNIAAEPNVAPVKRPRATGKSKTKASLEGSQAAPEEKAHSAEGIPLRVEDSSAVVPAKPKRVVKKKAAVSQQEPAHPSEASAFRAAEDRSVSETASPTASKGRRRKSAETAETAETAAATESAPVKPRRGRQRGETQNAAEASLEGGASQARESSTVAVAEAHVSGAPFDGANFGGGSVSENESRLDRAQPAQIAEPVRKPYPVYVPLHIAKQMEQSGKPAPLAIPPDAQQAAEIRAAAMENRLSPAPQNTPSPALAPQSEDDSRNHGGHHRQQRHPNQQRPQEGRGQERQRGRNERRRGGGRHEEHGNPRHNDGPRRQGDHAESHGHEGGRDLPPPTPEELFPGGGIIEISGKGFGFLRDPQRNYAQHPADIFVSPEMVRRFNLRDGQFIQGSVRKSGRGQQMHEIESVNGDAPEASRTQPDFDELTVINPCEPLCMATVPERYTTRIIDMMTPIGKGQRGLIVAQPRTGKTTLLQHIADAMMKNHPEVKLIMLLVDERPEEVTEIRHTVPKAEIMASSNDMDVRSHTRIAELAIERAKRLVEAGQDVFILLDSITRLGRAFNNALTNGGRTMSGGLDARALEVPRKLFAAARNTEEAGSLTIIATALIDTGSRMDEIIFQEFKGTGNMELVLDRKIAEQRIYPAVDIFQSGTRREELLVPADILQRIHFLRRGLSGCRPIDAIERLLFYLKKFQTNEQMLKEIRA